MADGCFLILCGIPASGKSTLARELIQNKWEIGGKCMHFIYVCYDDFIPENFVATQTCATWKAKRRDILIELEKLIFPNGDSVGFTPGDEKMGLSNRASFVSQACSCGTGYLCRGQDILHVIVIDDNMYYRSMRYEYYQLARKVSFGFAQIYMHCPADVALSRNASRTEHVAENIIIKMFDNIEQPDPEKFAWEKFSIVVDTNTNQREGKWMTILKLLQNAAGHVPSPLNVLSEEEKAMDRAVTEKNIIHQADQVIRKHISAELRRTKENPDGEDLKQAALSLNQRRKKLLEKLKEEPEKITGNALVKQFTISCKIKDTGVSPVVCTSEQPGDAEANLEGNMFPTQRTSDLDSRLLLENVWDLISVDEFAVIVRNLFEQCV